MSAAPPGATFSPSSFMKLSLTPASVTLPAAAPLAAPIAMPNSGARKSKPMKPPHSAPPAAPAPVVLMAWCSLILPSARCSTTTASSSWTRCSFVACTSSARTRSAVAASGYAIATSVLIAASLGPRLPGVWVARTARAMGRTCVSAGRRASPPGHATPEHVRALLFVSRARAVACAVPSRGLGLDVVAAGPESRGRAPRANLLEHAGYSSARGRVPPSGGGPQKENHGAVSEPRGRPGLAGEAADSAPTVDSPLLTTAPPTRPLPRLVRIAGCAGAVIAAALVALTVIALGEGSYAERLDRAVFELVIVVPPIAVGLYAVRFPRHARFGLMLLGAGLAWSLTALAASSQSLPYSIGRVAAWLMFPALIYLILAFPDGRLARGRDHRLFLGVTILVAVLFVGSSAFVDAYPEHTPWATCDHDCPANAFLVLGAEPAVMEEVVRPLREGLAVLLLIGVTVSLARRMRASTPLGRRTAGPVLVVSLGWTVVLIAYLVSRRAWPDAEAVDTLGVLWALLFPAIAVAFFAGLMRRRLLVGEVLGSLTLALSGRLDGRHVRDAVATALGDPALELLAPGPDPSRWRDTEGKVMPRPAAAKNGRQVTLIGDADAQAALVHDPALSDDTELLEVIGTLALAAVQQERLERQLDTSRVQLERSRSRIAKAADLERSRIERDLHDGAQQRLILLRIKLSLIEELMISDPSAVPAAVRGLGDEVELTLDELRALAHGVYPSILSDRGLEDALRSVALGLPVPVHFEVADLHRYSAEVETAVYFACLEASQNAIKHATGTTGLWITLRDDGALSFEVRDDGPGFDVPTGEYNGGLRNMRDRLEAVGGQLTMESAPGYGVGIRGRVPLD